MFTRRDPQPSKTTPETRQEPELAPTVIARPEPLAPQPEPVAAQPPVAATPQPAAADPQSMSLVAAGDTFEGKLITTNGVRVLGTVRGSIESKSNIQVDADALVEADLTAENVTIAGTYKGKLNCNGRLEITATGHANGDLDTGRILLHEGGFFEGTLHMKPDQPAAAPASGVSARRYGSDS